MSLESDLKAINTHLARIADALEGLLANQGIVSEPKADPKAKPTKDKKAPKQRVIGKPDKTDAAEPTFDDVRTALKAVKAEVSQAKVKSLLKEYGASTIGQLPEAKYGRIIADAEAAIE